MKHLGIVKQEHIILNQGRNKQVVVMNVESVDLFLNYLLNIKSVSKQVGGERKGVSA